MLSHGAPKFESFLLSSFINRRLEELRTKVTNAMPVNYNIQAEFFCQCYPLVKYFQIFSLTPFLPGRRMDWKSNDIRSPVFYFSKILFVPMTFRSKLIWVAGIQATEYEYIAIFIDKF